MIWPRRYQYRRFSKSTSAFQMAALPPTFWLPKFLPEVIILGWDPVQQQAPDGELQHCRVASIKMKGNVPNAHQHCPLLYLICWICPDLVMLFFTWWRSSVSYFFQTGGFLSVCPSPCASFACLNLSHMLARAAMPLVEDNSEAGDTVQICWQCQHCSDTSNLVKAYSQTMRISWIVTLWTKSRGRFKLESVEL